MDQKSSDDFYSDEETAARMERALKRALSTPHKPHKPAPDDAGPKPRTPKSRSGS